MEGLLNRNGPLRLHQRKEHPTQLTGCNGRIKEEGRGVGRIHSYGWVLHLVDDLFDALDALRIVRVEVEVVDGGMMQHVGIRRAGKGFRGRAATAHFKLWQISWIRGRDIAWRTNNPSTFFFAIHR